LKGVKTKVQDARFKQTLRKIDRLLELAPEYILNPSRIWHVARGAHPGVLVTLDKPWLRQLNVNTVLDVGANTGQFAQVAHTVFPKARIYAFEPLPSCQDQLREKMKGAERFQAFGTAIGRENGRVTMHESASSPSSSILPMTNEHAEAFPWTEEGREIEVDLRRLDYFLPQMQLEGLVLLKIDVQGYSMEVLMGASETLARVDLVLVETSVVTLYEGESTFDDVYQFLKDAGFTFTGVLDQLVHPESGAILQIDAIFQKAP
jgi:FkbM family methyltransferase